MAEQKLYRYKEAADLLSISLRTLHRAIAQGQLSPILAPGTCGPKGMRISDIELDRYVKTAQRQMHTMAHWVKRREESERKY